VCAMGSLREEDGRYGSNAHSCSVYPPQQPKRSLTASHALLSVCHFFPSESHSLLQFVSIPLVCSISP
jgi:hypothetical protein